MKISMIKYALSIAIASLLASACTPHSKEKDQKETITVSIPPLKYLIDKISGNDYNVNVMVATGACQETYEPTPKQMKDISKSNVYIGIPDLEFEQKWVNGITRNNDTLKYIDVTNGIEKEEATCNHSEHDGHHHHGASDPHYWLSPKNFKVMAAATYNELVALHPEKKEAYTANYNKLIASVDSIDLQIKSKLANLRTGKFIIYHPALTYFAKDYGLEQISIEKDGKEPAVDYMKTLINQAKKDNIKTIFVQKEFDISLIQSLGKEVGATVEPIDTFSYDWLDSMNKISNALSKANK